MKYKDLREFIAALEQQGELQRVTAEVDPYLEITEICDRTLRAGGPALLFENVKGHDMNLLGNLFGTPERVAMGMGQDSVSALGEVGELLAFLKEPEPPKGFRDALDKLPVFKQVMRMGPKTVRQARVQERVLEGDDVDLDRLPIQHCWPGDAAPLVTWPLVVTCGPEKSRQNLGIYRQQKLSRNRLIMRWLSNRGGARDYQAWCEAHPGEPFPVAVALGADASFVARTMDRDPKHMKAMMKASHEHAGTAFLEIYQNCNIFNDGAFFEFTERDTKASRALFVEDGEPLTYANGERGLRLDGLSLEAIDLTNERWSVSDCLVYDSGNREMAHLIGRMFDQPDLPRPFGVLYQTERPTYEQLLHDQLNAVRADRGDGDLEALLHSGETWSIDA
jgi:hypothetical protein